MTVTAPIMIRRVHGHSMVPVLPPGTLVVAWRWFRTLKPEKVVIFTRHGRETIKRIDHLTDQGIFVLGDHPETSTDSREYGVIPANSVTGVVFWPHTAKVLAAESDKRRRFGRRFIRRKDIEA